MGYRVVDVDDVEPAPDRPSELRRISEAADLSQMAVNRFAPEPGEQIPLAYHYHDDQEELLYVVDGEIEVETPEDTFAVEAEGAFAADPDSPQRAYCPEGADGRALVIAIGAPAVDDVHPYDPGE